MQPWTPQQPIAWAAAAAAAAGAPITVGDTGTALQTDTINQTLNLNTTAKTGDLIVALVMANDNDNADSTVTASITGFSLVVEEEDSDGSLTCYAGIFSKVASGGETSVSLSGSFSFGGTFDKSGFAVFTLSGLNSTTPIDTNTVHYNYLAVSGTGATVGFAAHVADPGTGSAAITGGGNMIDNTVNFDFNYGYDDAPPSGSITYSSAVLGDSVNAMVAATWG